MKRSVRILALAFLGFVLFFSAKTILADKPEKAEPYVPTVRLDRGVDLEKALKLDKDASDYCEKARDFCLYFSCGSIDPQSATKACWEECTNRRYEECKAK